MPDEDEELLERIAESAVAPKRVRGDSGEVEQHSIDDQLKLLRYRKSQAAARRGGLGVRFVKMIPPGQD